MLTKLQALFDLAQGQLNDLTPLSEKAKEICMELELPPQELQRLAKETKTWEDYKREVQRERELACKQEALARPDVLRRIAQQIPEGSPDSPLSGMEEQKTRREYGVKIADVLAEVQAERTKGGLTARMEEESKSKFSMEGGKDAIYGTQRDFHKGLVDLIGLPTKLDDLYEAIKEEHCDRTDSDKPFTTPNYNIPTTPRDEWLVVSDPARLTGGDGRKIRVVEELMEDSRVLTSELRREEVVALVLYTGPMYVKYNQILRSAKTSDASEEGAKNNYATTIHCIVSGVIKLSKLTKLPSSRLVYRGLSGLRMPERFVQEDELGVSGGVEYGMLSTTADKKMAVQYASKGETHPTVFEISCGAIDRGADLRFLSQYPGEKEFLYPPLSYLEVTRRPRLEEVEGQIVRVLPMRINANVTSSTIEGILGKRKELYVALLANVTEEIRRELEGLMRSEEVQKRLRQAARDFLKGKHKTLEASILKECEEGLSKYKDREIAWYNYDINYVQAMEHAKSLKGMAMNKIRYWLVSTMGDDQCERLSKQSMVDLYRMTLAELHLKAGEGGGESFEGREAAEKASKLHGVWREQQASGEDEDSSIMTAASKGQADMIWLLARAGKDVNRKNKDGSTALHVAATLGFLHCARELVAQGAEVHSRGSQGETCAYVASARGHVEALRFFGEVGGRELLMQTDDEGHTCAHVASQGGKIEALRYLAEVGGRELLVQATKQGQT
eukprot:764555-Hanusia_phi.AAC.1